MCVSGRRDALLLGLKVFLTWEHCGRQASSTSVGKCEGPSKRRCHAMKAAGFGVLNYSNGSRRFSAAGVWLFQLRTAVW